jgi:hypothetical protein
LPVVTPNGIAGSVIDRRRKEGELLLQLDRLRHHVDRWPTARHEALRRGTVIISASGCCAEVVGRLERQRPLRSWQTLPGVVKSCCHPFVPTHCEPS